MKISLITIWHVGNYGAEMQSYATIKTLQEMGHDVQMIDIRLTDTSPRTLKYRISDIIGRTSLIGRKFNKFWNNYFPTTRRYKSIEELRQNPPESDMYIVGSDQVWNPALTTSLANAYFLDFGPENTRRVSYASSFGFADFPDERAFRSNYLKLLERFSGISCREDSGVKLLKKLGIEGKNVLDPTLLRSDYRELTGEITEQNSLVYYPIGNHLESIEEFAMKLAAELHMSFANLMKRTYLLGRIGCNGLSVQEWIRNIASAKLVVTTSFHGVAFSLIYKRQFVVVISNHQRGSRITDLLDKLNLSNRYFFTLEDAKKSECWKHTINYDDVSLKLQELRYESFNFLKTAIDGK